MIDPSWLIEAKKNLGLHEGAGKANNPKVVEFYKLAGNAGVRDDEVPWCAAFVGAMLHLGNTKGTGSLSARSYEGWGQKLVNPVYGCVGVKLRKGGKSWQGHVGFVVGANAHQVFLLGGNQGDQVSIAAFPREDFTAFRWPSDIPIPKNPPPLAANLIAAKNVKEA